MSKFRLIVLSMAALLLLPLTLTAAEAPAATAPLAEAQAASQEEVQTESAPALLLEAPMSKSPMSKSPMSKSLCWKLGPSGPNDPDVCVPHEPCINNSDCSHRLPSGEVVYGFCGGMYGCLCPI